MSESGDATIRNESDAIRSAIVFVVALIAAHLLVGVRGFETNDDIGMLAMIKGLYGWAPGIDPVFMSPLFGALLRGGYSLAPSVPWFSIMLYGFLAAGAFAGGLAVIRARGGMVVTLAGLVGLGVLYLLAAILLSFTSAGLLLGVSALALLTQSCRSGNVWGWMERTAAFLLLPAAYLLRPGLGAFVVVFAAPLLLALWERRSVRVALQTLGPLLAFAAVDFVSTKALRSGAEHEQFARFNSVRAAFTDTKRSTPSEKTAAALAAVEWSREDYLAIANWWLHDGTVFTEEKITRFLQVNAGPSAGLFDLGAAFGLAAQTWVLLLSLVVWAGAMLASRTPDDGPTRMQPVWILLLCFVLFMMGVRFPPRFALPCYAMLILSALFLKGSGAQGPKRHLITAGALLFAVLISCVGWTRVSRLRTMDQERFAGQQAMDQGLLQVAETTGGKMLLVEVSPVGFSFPFRESDPALQVPMLPTGWMVGSPTYYQQLKLFALGDRNTMVKSMIDNPQILFRHSDSPDLPFDLYVQGAWLTHLKSHYDEAGSGKTVGIKIIRDDRKDGRGVIYFRLTRQAA